jgi:hypothetical protein
VVIWYYGTVSYVLNYSGAAQAALDALAADPDLAAAHRAVIRTLGRLEEDPFDPKLGTIAFMTEELGGVSATTTRFGDWYMLWQRGPQPGEIDIITVIELPL